jgi:hypothetical protein
MQEKNQELPEFCIWKWFDTQEGPLMIHSSKQLPGSGGAFDVVFSLLCHIKV